MEGIKRGPGRPQAIAPAQRREKIIDVAGSIFITEGYSSTNMETIAQRCGMSKKTLYQVFENKEALFSALICDVQRYEENPHQTQGIGAVENDLFGTLLRIAEWTLAPRQIGLTRLVIAESLASPALAEQFRGHAIEQGRRMIRESLVRSLKKGRRKNVAEIEAMTAFAFGAAIAELQLRALVGEDISSARMKASLSKHIEHVVRLVLPEGCSASHPLTE